MAATPSPIHLRVLRAVFLLNGIVLGVFVLRALFGRSEWDAVRGVAYSFWAAWALLSLVGVRYPLSMVPVLLMQFVYKAVWLGAIYPRASSDAGLLPIMVAGLIGDLVVIPWTFVPTLLRRG
jgi:hypothetical protein